jgi:hypothetical protein
VANVFTLCAEWKITMKNDTLKTLGTVWSVSVQPPVHDVGQEPASFEQGSKLILHQYERWENTITIQLPVGVHWVERDPEHIQRLLPFASKRRLRLDSGRHAEVFMKPEPILNDSDILLSSNGGTPRPQVQRYVLEVAATKDQPGVSRKLTTRLLGELTNKELWDVIDGVNEEG